MTQINQNAHCNSCNQTTETYFGPYRPKGEEYLQLLCRTCHTFLKWVPNQFWIDMWTDRQKYITEMLATYPLPSSERESLQQLQNSCILTPDEEVVYVTIANRF